MRRVALVGGGRVSLPHFWASADEIWAVKYVSFALHELGFKVSKSFWQDDINSVIKKWSDGVYNRLTKEFDIPDCEVWVSNLVFLEHFAHIHKFPYAEAVEKFKSDYINHSGAMALVGAGMFLEPGDELHVHGFDYFPENPDKLTNPRMKDLIRQGQCCGYWLRALQDYGLVIKINPMSPTLDTYRRSTHGARIRGLYWSELLDLPTTNKSLMEEIIRNTMLNNAANTVKDVEEAPLAPLNSISAPLEVIDLFTAGQLITAPNLHGVENEETKGNDTGKPVDNGSGVDEQRPQ